jgi:hypothetical protein
MPVSAVHPRDARPIAFTVLERAAAGCSPDEEGASITDIVTESHPGSV